MTTVRTYKSTDASAPTQDGQNGSTVTVWDACLVNGFGALLGAGWTKPFTGTNQAAFRMDSVSGLGHYVQLNDNNPNASAVGREARARGFVAMSSVTAGTEPFPTTTQVADTAGPMIRKSATADSTARPWIMVADERTMYYFTKPGDFTGWSGYMFGEYYSLKSGDLYRSACIGRIVSGGTGPALDSSDNLPTLSLVNAAGVGHYTPRNWANDIAGAVAIGKHGNAAHSATVLTGLLHYPNLVDNALHLSPVWLHMDIGNLSTVLGRLRGFWQILHPVAADINDGDTFSGTGVLAGKEFLVIKPDALATGTYVIETSSTWETN